MSNAHGDANSDAATQNSSHVMGANSVAISSGGDTNVIGSDVTGGTVNANVGGNLNVASVQDTTVSAAHQSSVGGGFGISTTGGSASFSAQNGHGDGDYAQVNGQAGIRAGDGGFDITVKGNTDLKGAVMTSTADPSRNSLTTDTLTFSDVENHSHYSATSTGISAGLGVGNTGKATGPGSVSGSGGGIPMALNESGDQNATTRSAIGAGTINVTDAAHQTQDVANLSRDATDTNGTVSKTPDVNAILNQQADTIQAAQAAAQVVAQGIGAYADSKKEAADKAAETALKSGEMDAYRAAVAESKSWDEGGSNRVALHVAGGALIGGLGGGGFGAALQGAAGAGLSAAMAKQLDDIYKGVGSATGSELLGNIAANVVSGVGGALVGGGMGATMASSVELYNQSAHRKKNDLVSQACPATGQCNEAVLNAAIQAQGDLSQAASQNMGIAVGAAAMVVAVPALAALGPEALALALSNPAAAVNAGIITVETAAAIATNSVTPGVAIEGAAAKAGSAADMTTAAQLRTQLAFQDAGLLDTGGKLTQAAIDNSRKINLSGTGTINNPAIAQELTKDGSSIADWGKYTTQSVMTPNGQSLQIHDYMNSVTGRIDYVTPDYKVKGIVQP